MTTSRRWAPGHKDRQNSGGGDGGGGEGVQKQTMYCTETGKNSKAALPFSDRSFSKKWELFGLGQEEESYLAVDQILSVIHNPPGSDTYKMKLRCFVFRQQCPTWHDCVTFYCFPNVTHHASVCSTCDDPCTCGLGCLWNIVSNFQMICPWYKQPLKLLKKTNKTENSVVEYVKKSSKMIWNRY